MQNRTLPGTLLIFVLLLGLAIFWSACKKEEPLSFSGPGKRPVYVPLPELNNITNLPPQTVVQSGTIFLQDTLFFMLEQKKGIHVFNVKDSLNVAALTFFQIPAITDFTISGNRLYADSWKDLVTIDISDLYHIQVRNRESGVFNPLLYPPLYEGIFECVDESRGAVVGWEDVYLEAAYCRSTN